jgi:hypothetical protein
MKLQGEKYSNPTSLRNQECLEFAWGSTVARVLGGGFCFFNLTMVCSRWLRRHKLNRL